MEDLLQTLFPKEYLDKEGIRDFDDLLPDEQGSYLEMLKIQEQAVLTIDDVKKHVTAMRQQVEYELAKMPEGDKRNGFYKARLLNYLLFENLFNRPEKAKQMLKSYSQRKKL